MDTPITAKAVLLQVLLEGPGYGTELRDRASRRTKGAINILQGSLYPALRHLEEDGYIRAVGDKTIRAYELTKFGKALALEQQKTLRSISNFES